MRCIEGTGGGRGEAQGGLLKARQAAPRPSAVTIECRSASRGASQPPPAARRDDAPVHAEGRGGRSTPPARVPTHLLSPPPRRRASRRPFPSPRGCLPMPPAPQGASARAAAAGAERPGASSGGRRARSTPRAPPRRRGCLRRHHRPPLSPPQALRHRSRLPLRASSRPERPPPPVAAIGQYPMGGCPSGGGRCAFPSRKPDLGVPVEVALLCCVAAVGSSPAGGAHSWGGPRRASR